MSVTVLAIVPRIKKHLMRSDDNIDINDLIDSVKKETKTQLKETKMEDDTSNILEWEQIQTEDDALLRKNKNRMNLLTKMLSEPILNSTSIRRACWRGIPTRMRSSIWKLLLGYIPPKLSRRQYTLNRKRLEYFDLIERYYIKINAEHRSDQEKDALIQIEKDVDRMDNVFQIQRIKQMLSRSLYIWSLKHTATGYVQGIHDLITPFVYIFLSEYIEINEDIDILTKRMDQTFSENDLFRIEADCYWCLDHLIEGLQINYIDNQPGITSMLSQLESVINRMNHKLYQHFKKKGVQFFQFAYRWMNCLLMRELSLMHIIRLWDTYLCEGVNASCSFAEFHVFVCAALLLSFQKDLMDKEFDEIVIFLQNLKHKTSNWSEREIEMILSQAFVYQQLFGK